MRTWPEDALTGGVLRPRLFPADDHLHRRGLDPLLHPGHARASVGTCRTLDVIPTHYETLGVAPDASAAAIRASYRARARMHHPDRAGGSANGVSMADINEAYRVLKDPERRERYDRSLAGGNPGSVRSETSVKEDTPVVRRARPTLLSPDGPARFPWKPMLIVGAIGSLLVLVSAAMADPPAEQVPDGIIQTDSCVAIEPNGDAREVACTGEDDIVVELLIPTGARCPSDMEPHRDRLGLGIACIVP